LIFVHVYGVGFSLKRRVYGNESKDLFVNDLPDFLFIDGVIPVGVAGSCGSGSEFIVA
jgi:hypothetical protein